MADRFKKIESVVNGMLQLFEKYEIHSTWAVVGLLGHSSLEDLIAKNESGQISYSNKNFSAFPITLEKYKEIPFEILTGLKEVKQILKTPNQELASHTFAHYYTLEEGQTEEEFSSDLAAMKAFGNQLGHTFKSIVFPRNQVNPSYLKILKDNEYLAYRGNQENKDWANSTYLNETKGQKVRRVLDAYFKISKTKTQKIAELSVENGLLNIPASRFLRPNRGKAIWERRKLKRVKEEMTQAAKNETVYHLWWHPHNFTFEPELSLIQLEEILKHFQTLKKQYQLTSINMGEIADHVKK